MPPQNNIEARIAVIEERLAQQDLQQLSYPLDSYSKEIIQNLAVNPFLKEQIFDIFWDKIYHYSTWFESVDAYEIQSGTVAPDGGLGIALTTGATSGNTAEMLKNPETQDILRWDKRQAFRASFYMNSVTSVTMKICIAQETPAGGAIATGYGFKLTDNALKGVSANGTSETEIDLATTVSTGSTAGIDVEAKFFPGEKIIFLVDKKEQGVITANLPSNDTTPLHDNFVNVWIKTNAAGAKIMHLTYFEYIQLR